MAGGTRLCPRELQALAGAQGATPSGAGRRWTVPALQGAWAALGWPPAALPALSRPRATALEGRMEQPAALGAF